MKYLAFILIVFSNLIHAVEVTTSEGIQIKSDFTTADFKNEITQYEGNVVVTQANLVFEADVIKEYRKNKVLTKLVGTGSPTVFINKLATVGELSKGTANEVIYIPAEGKVYLSDYTLTDLAGNTQSSKQGVFLLAD